MEWLLGRMISKCLKYYGSQLTVKWMISQGESINQNAQENNRAHLVWEDGGDTPNFEPGFQTRSVWNANFK